jgi:hypothetical protein
VAGLLRKTLGEATALRTGYHYEIAETIANPHGFVGREILEQRGLRPA